MTVSRWLWPILLAMLVVACGDADSNATDLRPADLVRFQDRYDGETVATTGVVNMFAEPEHYWVEDEQANRVRIEPHDAVSDLVGQRVRVVGRFEYTPDKGRVIHVHSVDAVD